MAELDFEPGRTISHFRIEKLLGEGGMGAVYLAEDLTLSRRVAIKFMHRSLLVQQADETFREGLEKRFIREAKSAAAINHPNLAQIYEANFDSENWFIAMEYIDGASLYDLLIEGKKFSVKEIINVCRQVISGLDFAWENYKIVHRDIKPHNIMLTKNNLVKIVDLGLAKPLASDDTEYEMPDLTCAGTPIGTPQYMAPEQATGQKDITYLVDIFSLGATLYEVLSGNKAFTGNTAPMIYIAQVQKKYTSLGEVKKDLPNELVTLIHSMLEPKAEDRISSYQKILDALNMIELGADIDKPRSFSTRSVNRPLSTIQDQLSSKTVGMEPLSTYHPTDMLIKDRYRILKAIGKSVAGIVYHCIDTRLGVECVVKSIFPGREYREHEMPSVVANFQKLMSLSHPNLVQIRDLQLDEETGEFFVVMELLEGQNLREYTYQLRNQVGDINIEEILPVITAVGKAVDSVSKTFNMVHDDLIPEKIYVLKNENQVKLFDYGITTPSDDDREAVKEEDQYKFPLATPDYMSPELWRRKPITRQSDQYSLAVVIYEMLAEKLPFWLKDPIHDEFSNKNNKTLLHERRLLNLYNRVLTAAPNPLAELKRHENDAILKALSKDPHERFPNCENFIKTLKGSRFVPKGMKIAACIAASLMAIVILVITHRNRNSELKQQIFEKMSRCEHLRDEVKKTEMQGFFQLLQEFDTKTREADASNSKGNYDQAINLYDEAITLGRKWISQVSKLQLSASQAKASCKGLLDKLIENAVSSSLLNKYNAKIRDADENFTLDNYEVSIRQYEDAQKFANEILESVDRVRKQKMKIKDVQKRIDKSRDAYAENKIAKELLIQFDLLLKNSSQEYNRNQLKKAISSYQKAINLGERILTIEEKPPSNEEFRDVAVKVQIRLEKVREKYSKERSLRPRLSDLDSMIKQANELFDSENYAQAIKEYEKGLNWADGLQRQQDKAAILQQALKEIFQDFSKNDDLKTIASELNQGLGRGTEAYDKGNFAQAVTEYEKTIEKARDFEDRIKQDGKLKALALQKEALNLRGQLKQYKKLTAEVTEKIVRVDVTLSLARESLKKEDIKDAIERYSKAIADATALLSLAHGKFQANKGQNYSDPKIGMEFVWIKSLDFWVGKYEVTNDKYRKFKSTHDSKKAMGFSLNKDRQPVIEVSYYDAVGFCEFMNTVSLKEVKAPPGYTYRLPARKEWEKIAQCGEERLYPWGNDWPPKYGNFGNQEVFPGKWQLDGYSDEFPVTCEVEKSGKNKWGIFGLAGNVWEWTTDLSDDKRIVLGGDWTSVTRATLIITIQGARAQMNEPYDNIGFRVLLAPEYN